MCEMNRFFFGSRRKFYFFHFPHWSSFFDGQENSVPFRRTKHPSLNKAKGEEGWVIPGQDVSADLVYLIKLPHRIAVCSCTHPTSWQVGSAHLPLKNWRRVMHFLVLPSGQGQGRSETFTFYDYDVDCCRNSLIWLTTSLFFSIFFSHRCATTVSLSWGGNSARSRCQTAVRAEHRNRKVRDSATQFFLNSFSSQSPIYPQCQGDLFCLRRHG